MIKLIGIVLVAVGFAFRANLLLVVLVAGIVTGWVSGMSFREVLEEFGKLFVDNRLMMLPVILMVPMIGLLERHGLREAAEQWVRRSRASTPGRVVWLYTALRQITIALGISIGGHAGAVRPIVAPMAEGAAKVRHGALTDEEVQDIRAHAAAAENIGNFFGEDVFIAVGAVLLMKGFFESQGVAVGLWSLALWGLPTAIVALLTMGWRARALDRRLARRREASAETREAP